MNSALEKRFEELYALALKMGLDPFPISFEEVPREIIWDTASYGLPTRMSHWSFGKSFLHQKMHGEMGFSKIYELIINSNPSLALLDETNDDVSNLLICAHCYVPGTYVQTISGLKKIEDVTNKDMIYNVYGDTERVAYPTTRNFNGDVVTVQAGSNQFTQTDDHQLFAVRFGKKIRTKQRSWKKAFAANEIKPSWVNASKLKAGDFLVVNKPKNIGNGLLPSIAIDIKKRLHNQDINTTIQIPLNEEFGELIGLYLAEGYAREKGQMGLCFHTHETALHERAEYLVKKYFKLPTYISVCEETHSHQVLFNEICIANFLRKFLGDGCYLKSLPSGWMVACSKEFLQGVLRGYLLGDGDKRAPRSMGFSTASPKLAMQIQQIAMTLGIYIGVHAKDKSSNQQKRSMSFIGSSSGIYDCKLRKLLGLPERKCTRQWSGVIEHGDQFYVKINAIQTSKYKGNVHCLNIPRGSSFTLANGIVTHNCYGHSDFFKNNSLFAPTNRNMVNQAEANAKVIESFKDKYGVDTVEDWMDVAFAIDNHIDWNRGEDRVKYPLPQHIFKTLNPLPYADICGEDTKPQVIEEVINTAFPPHKEKDLLWFLTNYAQMLPWQREVFSIIRSESFYFYPQGQTKIINEGWASFWHAEIMLNYDNLSPAEHLDFCNAHSRIVRPGGGGSLNPYYVGFRILTDLKKRWDEYYAEGQKDAAFLKSDEVDHVDEKGKIVMSKQTGYQKIFQVRREEDDISFVGNYLTRELAEDMKLFTYGLAGVESNPEEDDIILLDRELEKVKHVLTSRMHNNGAPLIYITEADESYLYLEHEKIIRDPYVSMAEYEYYELEPFYAKKTLEYIYQAWKRPVVLKTHDESGNTIRYEAGKDGITEEVTGADSSSRKFQI